MIHALWCEVHAKNVLSERTCVLLERIFVVCGAVKQKTQTEAIALKVEIETKCREEATHTYGEGELTGALGRIAMLALATTALPKAVSRRPASSLAGAGATRRGLFEPRTSSTKTKVIGGPQWLCAWLASASHRKAPAHAQNRPHGCGPFT